jgi:hypothetical protein
MNGRIGADSLPFRENRLTFRRLVFVDVDGTLLRSDGSIAEATRMAIAEAADAGIGVVLASGRRRFQLLRLAADLTPGLPAIAHNGALIFRGTETIRASSIPPPVLSHAVGIAAEHAMQPVIFTADFERNALAGPAEADGPAIARYLEPSKGPVQRLPLDLLRREREAVFFVTVDARDTVVKAAAALAGGLGDAGWDVAAYPQSATDAWYLELSERASTKLGAARAIARLLGVPWRQVAAIGDFVNDVDLLRGAPLSYAMANGHADALAAADRIAPSNDEDGVAAVLRELAATTPLPSRE